MARKRSRGRSKHASKTATSARSGVPHRPPPTAECSVCGETTHSTNRCKVCRVPVCDRCSHPAQSRHGEHPRYCMSCYRAQKTCGACGAVLDDAGSTVDVIRTGVERGRSFTSLTGYEVACRKCGPLCGTCGGEPLCPQIPPPSWKVPEVRLAASRSRCPDFHAIDTMSLILLLLGDSANGKSQNPIRCRR